MDSDKAFSAPDSTILEAFVRQAIAHPGEAAVADDLSGVVTYERMLVGARLMAKRFVELPGESVGLMLPASVAADIAFMALLWAGKLPILLNWDHRARQPQPCRESHGHEARHHLAKICRPRRNQD